MHSKTAVLHCPRCGEPQERDWSLQWDRISGSFSSEKQAAEHAVLSDNIARERCGDCGQPFFVAFVDQRW